MVMRTPVTIAHIGLIRQSSFVLFPVCQARRLRGCRPSKNAFEQGLVGGLGVDFDWGIDYQKKTAM
jgi:hypothetical protein